MFTKVLEVAGLVIGFVVLLAVCALGISRLFSAGMLSEDETKNAFADEAPEGKQNKSEEK